MTATKVADLPIGPIMATVAECVYSHNIAGLVAQHKFLWHKRAHLLAELVKCTNVATSANFTALAARRWKNKFAEFRQACEDSREVDRLLIIAYNDWTS